jgi:hypothetical protein
VRCGAKMARSIGKMKEQDQKEKRKAKGKRK